MWKHQLCINVSDGFGAPISELIPMCRRIGFEGFFTHWDPGMIGKWKEIGDETGMFYQSIHAPYGRTAQIWNDNVGEAEGALAELLACCEDCARYEIPVMVSHVYIGDFNVVGTPSEAGIERYGRIVERADALGVRVAFENTEGEEYLDAILRTFRGHPSLGFCLDAGHEMCYNRSRDLLADYGDLLCATHINDNLGISRADGNIFWTDDLHLLPFDGICDWDRFAARLDACGYHGPMTFELNNGSKPDRHDNDKYGRMGLEGFLTEAYARACRVAAKRKTV